jgi:CO dehydrogenase maturation factor
VIDEEEDMKIAVSGKGGVGKTTISSNLAKLFAKKGYNVYAVDADPDSSLGLTLGISQKEFDNIKPIVQMRDVIGKKAGDGAMYSLNPIVDDVIEEYSVPVGSKIKFLRMGDIKRGGTECYCRENTFLKALVNSLILNTKDVVILDMGAGIEHLTRGTSKDVDLMLIVTEAGQSSVQTARVVEELSKDLNVKKVKFIANKIRTKKEEDFIRNKFKDSELLGILRYDESISEKSMGFGESTGEVDSRELEEVLEKVVMLDF